MLGVARCCGAPRTSSEIKELPHRRNRLTISLMSIRKLSGCDL
ncbi:hypothetical protein C7S16_2865 [Burkholderia thailandensis]|uniref:Uncharacterized protein n=1 Tax=Burkholderia thailandensis TaxID=57975 RepID=A0AAW9CYE5_BURTH|nr:hypothetical protein [Burkholderia thailandensis]MDW9255925.1 hypothetical protein [Burkholderia thailandensis]